MKTNWSYLSLQERERIAYAEGDVELSRLLCGMIDTIGAQKEADEDWERNYEDAVSALREIADIVGHYA